MLKSVLADIDYEYLEDSLQGEVEVLLDVILSDLKYNLGLCFFLGFKPKVAIDIWEEALAKVPENSEIYFEINFQIGRAYLKLENDAEARKYFNIIRFMCVVQIWQFPEKT